MVNIDALAKVIAEGLGYAWDSLYESKIDWIDDRGKRHDINTPFKYDFVDAAEAVIRFLETNET